MMTALYKRCLNKEEIPYELRICYISSIRKKCPKDCQNNSRVIAVIPTIGRIYSRIIMNLIEVDVTGKQPEEVGFRAGRSTLDNPCTLKIAVEKRTQGNRATHMAFAELGRAHDSVPISQ